MIITDWGQVTDAGLAAALRRLTPAQAAQVGAITSITYVPDPYGLAVADGLIPDSQPGRDALMAAHQAVSGGGSDGFANVIVASPALAGLWASWDAVNTWRDNTLMDPSIVLGELLGTNTSFRIGLEPPTSLSAAQLAPYFAQVQKYFPTILAQYRAAAADTAQQRNNLVYLVMTQARANEAAKGITTLGNGQVVATSLIFYHVTLPDGVVYVVMNDVTDDPNNRYVYHFNGPEFVPLVTDGFSERNGITTCINAKKGTGNWYEAGAFNLFTSPTCDTTPDSFDRNYRLITPDILAAMSYQSGAPVVLTPPATIPADHTVGPDGTTTSPQTGTLGPAIVPNPAPVTVPVSGIGVGGGGGAPLPATAGAGDATQGGMVAVLAVVLVILLLAILSRGN